jgi:hypothetical protein
MDKGEREEITYIIEYKERKIPFEVKLIFVNKTIS